VATLVSLSVKPLLDFVTPLGLTPDDLASVEGPERIFHTFPLTATAVAGMTDELVWRLLAAYGTAIEVKFNEGDLERLIIVTGVSEENLQQFRAAAAAAPTTTYDFVLKLDKKAIAKTTLPTTGNDSVSIYAFTHAFCSLLKRGIQVFETELWPDPHSRLVVLLMDQQASFVGKHLCIVGPNHQPEAATFLGSPAPDYAHVDVVLASRDRFIGWDRPWVKGLTPAHFLVEGESPDKQLTGLLAAQLVKLAVLYTCDRSRAREVPGSLPEIRAEFRGREYATQLVINESAILDIADPVALKSVADLVVWCYGEEARAVTRDRLADRLPLVQTRVAQALESRPEEDRFLAFASSMPYLLEGIEWYWKAFVDGRISDYVGVIQQLESLVADTVHEFSSQTASLTSSLVSNMLAAVGVLVGTFVAAAFSHPFNQTLFRIGVLAYAAYVAIFPGIYAIRLNTWSLGLAYDEFSARKDRFKEVLLPERVDDIVGDRVTKAQNEHKSWRAWVIFAYVILVGAAIVAAITVPGAVSPGSAVH